MFELSFGNLKLHLHNLYVNDPSWITWQGIFDNNLQFWQDSNRNKFLIYVEKNEQIFMMKDLICDEKGSFSAKILFNNGMELIGKWKNYSMLAEYYLPCLKSLLASNVILSKYVKTEEKNKEQ